MKAGAGEAVAIIQRRPAQKIRALAIDQKLSPDTLEVASHLNNLGIVAQLHDDLDRAQEMGIRKER